MSAKNDSILIKAPAKVNLYLDVVGERPDGYHDIRSVIMPIDLCDVIELQKTDGDIETVVECSDDGLKIEGKADEGLWKSEKNLATRAANALKKEAGYAGGVKILIKKGIPVGGGLAGGSTDAAAVLGGLNKLWDTGLSKEKLMEISLSIGSDIPALVHGGAVCVEGIGEKVSGLSTSPEQSNGKGWWLVLVNPGFSVSTKDIYQRCSVALTSKERLLRSMCSALEKGDLDTVSEHLFNGLQQTVFDKYPLIRMIAEDLEKAGSVGVLLAGSGASVFGLARDQAHAAEIADRVGDGLEVPLWTRTAKLLPLYCPMV
jgi:4-diphosphocytidyl-2-C-methyl-D-erythritol kinase